METTNFSAPMRQSQKGIIIIFGAQAFKFIKNVLIPASIYQDKVLQMIFPTVLLDCVITMCEFESNPMNLASGFNACDIGEILAIARTKSAEHAKHYASNRQCIPHRGTAAANFVFVFSSVFVRMCSYLFILFYAYVYFLYSSVLNIFKIDEKPCHSNHHLRSHDTIPCHVISSCLKKMPCYYPRG